MLSGWILVSRASLLTLALALNLRRPECCDGTDSGVVVLVSRASLQCRNAPDALRCSQKGGNMINVAILPGYLVRFYRPELGHRGSEYIMLLLCMNSHPRYLGGMCPAVAVTTVPD